MNMFKELPRNEWVALIEPSKYYGVQEVRLVYIDEVGRVFVMLEDYCIEEAAEGEILPIVATVSDEFIHSHPNILTMFKHVYVKETVWKKRGE